MSLFDKVTAFLPIGKKEEKKEYFFAINIEKEELEAALWSIEGKDLKILSIATEAYSSEEEIVSVVDKLLDSVVGIREIEPQKILFGVPNNWVLDENLKEEYLKILRVVVKELELMPMAYVVTSNALVHFLEKKEGVPATAILIGFEKKHLTITVVRAGKIDGVKTIQRGESAGVDIEKVLLQFTQVETLPSKILIYGSDTDELKKELLSFSWMSKLSFLHFPKIETLEEDLTIKSICLAGGMEINSALNFVDESKKQPQRLNVLKEENEEKEEKQEEEKKEEEPETDLEQETEPDLSEKSNLGFVVGDISEKEQTDEVQMEESNLSDQLDESEENLSVEPVPPKRKVNIFAFVPKKIKLGILPLGIGVILVFIAVFYLFILKANIKVFVEPKVLETNAEVVADPNQKTVNEEGKIIPAQIVEIEVSGTAKDTASGKKEIGDPAKGTIAIYNKTSDSQTVSKGTQITSSSGLKFTLDSSVTIASQSASDSGITFGKATGKATAAAIGADGNLPSGANFTVSGFSSDKVSAKSEGNFSGGTSKEVTVVSSDDVQRLLAKLSSDLRQQAQQKLQEKYQTKKILKEALSETIVRKSYSKNINDAAGDFSLDMTADYKGTAFDDADLKTIVSKLVTTEVPQDFKLDLSETETQADVSKLEKNGKLIFLARFKAKLLPKIDTDEIKAKIKFKSQKEAQNIIKSMENVLGSEIKLSPKMPSIFGRLPILSKNMTIDVGLK